MGNDNNYINNDNNVNDDVADATMTLEEDEWNNDDESDSILNLLSRLASRG